MKYLLALGFLGVAMGNANDWAGIPSDTDTSAAGGANDFCNAKVDNPDVYLVRSGNNVCGKCESIWANNIHYVDTPYIECTGTNQRLIEYGNAGYNYGWGYNSGSFGLLLETDDNTMSKDICANVCYRFFDDSGNINTGDVAGTGEHGFMYQVNTDTCFCEAGSLTSCMSSEGNAVSDFQRYEYSSSCAFVPSGNLSAPSCSVGDTVFTEQIVTGRTAAECHNWVSHNKKPHADFPSLLSSNYIDSTKSHGQYVYYTVDDETTQKDCAYRCYNSHERFPQAFSKYFMMEKNGQCTCRSQDGCRLEGRDNANWQAYNVQCAASAPAAGGAVGGGDCSPTNCGGCSTPAEYINAQCCNCT